MQRRVIDSNMLQSDALAQYLAASTRNYAVLPDYLSMEAYKGDTLASIHKSMGILEQFPRQVLVLKGTQEICGLVGRGRGLQNRLIDHRQSNEFSNYCDKLRKARQGHQPLEQALLAHGRAASQHMDRLLESAANMPIGFDAVASIFSADEIRTLRQRLPYSPTILDKTAKAAMTIAAVCFRDHPRVRAFSKSSG